MKKTILLLVTLGALTHLSAAEPVGINQLRETPASFTGRAITVTGLVDRVSKERRMVVLIDTSEATCTDACERKTLIVQIPEGSTLPEKGDISTATGTLLDGGTRFVATALSSR